MASASVASSTLPCSSLVRRTANPHPNLWDHDFVQSLKSPYTDSCYSQRVETLIGDIKVMLSGEGESMITPSAYDTAWVARVPSIDGFARPQFPQTLQWILENQLKDGSWGNESHFLLSDRLLATLSCVLALLKWKLGDLQVQKGIEFIKSNLEEIKDENDQDSLVTDFEIIFPSLLREAQCLDLGLPYSLPYVSLLQAKRQERLAKLSNVNNPKILELAKLDFNIIQAIHQKEMKNVTAWFKDSEFPLLPFGRERPVECFFIIAAGTYEPQYAKCRFLFSKVACLNTVLDDMYDTYGTLDELKLFTEAVRRWDLSLTENLPDYMKLCYKIFYDIVHEVVWEAEKEQGRELLSFFRKGWEDYLQGYYEEADWLASEYVPSLEEYIKNGIISIGQRILLVSGVLLMKGQILSQEALEQLDYPGRRVLTELNCIITRLADDIHTYKAEKARGELASSVECYMKEYPGSTEEVAVSYINGLLEPAVKELTWEFLKPDDTCDAHIPFQCKKMLMEETRVTMVIFKEGDGFGISKTKIKEYIRECFIEPLPL